MRVERLYLNPPMFARGWWVQVDGRMHYLWREEDDEPGFDLLVGVVAELAPVRGLEATLDVCRADRSLVRLPKEVIK